MTTSQVGLVEKIYVFVIAAYPVFAPIYWLPGVPSQLLAYAKTGLFVLLALLALPTLQRAGRFWGGLYIGLGVAAVAAFSINLAQEGLAGGAMGTEFHGGVMPAFALARDFLEPLAWLLVLNSMRQSALPYFYRSLKICLGLFVLVVAYPLAASAGLAPNFKVPPEFFVSIRNFGTYNYLIGVAGVAETGFNSARTGWGPPVVTGMLALAATLLVPDGNGRRRVLWAVAVVALAFVATVSIGGRGATLAVFVVGSSWLLLARGNQGAALWCLWAAAIGSLLVDWGALLPERFLKDAGSANLFERFDYVTTGRLTTYVQAVRNFVSSPLIGVGTERSFVLLRSGELLQIHNVWLRLLSEGGLLLAAPVFWCAWRLLRQAISLRKTSGPGSEFGLPNFRPVMVGGFMMSMMEPSLIFGVFNNNALFWTCAWILVSIRTGRITASAIARPPRRRVRAGPSWSPVGMPPRAPGRAA